MHFILKMCGKGEKKMNDVVKIDKEDFGVLAVCAIRYCQGRQSYMPSLVISILKPHIAELTNRDLQVMINDCDYQAQLDLYGSETVDKPGWLEWKDILIQEQETRKKKQDRD